MVNGIPTFEDVDARRQQLGVAEKALYQRAKVSHGTWYHLRAGRTGNVRTMLKLASALDEIAAEQAQGGAA